MQTTTEIATAALERLTATFRTRAGGSTKIAEAAEVTETRAVYEARAMAYHEAAEMVTEQLGFLRRDLTHAAQVDTPTTAEGKALAASARSLADDSRQRAARIDALLATEVDR